MARPKAPEKKEWIRKAAISLISREGFHSVTTDEIAVEAGVSVGTIYNYFKNKADILSYIFQVEHTKLNIYFARIKKRELSIPEKFKLLISQFFKYALNNKDIAKVLHGESNKPDREIAREILNYMSTIRVYLKDLLREGVEEGTVCDCYDLDMMINVIIGAASGSVFYYGHYHLEKKEYISKKESDELFNILSNGVFKVS